MSHIHEELEVGAELDQAVRTAVTAVAQVIERITRQSTDRARAHATTARDEARTADQAARDLGRQAEAGARDTVRATQMAHREQQQAARRELMNQTSAARAAYGPWTYEGKVERGERVAASQAWGRAAAWAQQDPRARDAQENLSRRIRDTFGVEPSVILASIDPQHGHPTGVPAGAMSVREAGELARKYGPYYYQGTDADMFGRVSNRALNPVQERFVADWQEWAQTGSLPHETLVRSWATHVGDDGVLDAGAFTGIDGVVDHAAQAAALEQVWEQGREQRDHEAYAQHLADLHAAQMDTTPARLAGGEHVVDENDMDQHTGARSWEPLLDLHTFREASGPDAVAAWRAAATAAAADPNDHAAAAAADQLATQIRTVHGPDVALYLADAVLDQQVARTDARRAEQDGARAAAEARDDTTQQHNDLSGDQDATVLEPPAAHTEPQVGATGDRGVAPSKAQTPQERQHRIQAWRTAEERFRSTLPHDTTPAQARAAWAGLGEPDKYARYWSAYDAGTASDPTRMVTNPVATTAVAVSPQPQQTGQGQAVVPRERVIELNTVAAQWYGRQLRPGTPGHDYLTKRLGEEAMTSGRWSLGYAPDQWNGLARQLRSAAGASDQEIVGAGLGRISSRGSVIDAFRNRAMVAVTSTDGEVVGFYGRDLSGSDRNPTHLGSASTTAYTKGDHVFGLYEAPAGARLARTEATFDAIALTQASDGQLWGVAPMGTSLTDTQAAAITGRAGVDGKVWLANDGDAAGRRATEADFWKFVQQGADPRLVAIPPGQDPAGLWSEDPDTLRAVTQYPDTHPSAGLQVLEHAIDTEHEGLLAGDADAYDRVDMSERDIHGVLHNDVDRAFLSSQAKSLLEGVHAEREAKATWSEYVEDRDHRGDTVNHEQNHGQQQEFDDAPVVVNESRENATQNTRTDDIKAYNRADACDIDNLSPAARRVALGTAHGYSQSTTDMLNTATKGSDTWKAKQGTHNAGPSQNRTKGSHR